MTERVAAVIQARMGSTRLPGKVLRPLGPRPVLDWVVRAARQAEGIDEVVVATTTEPEDDAIDDRARLLGTRVHRGPVDDVLSRFLGAVAADPVDVAAIVRLTADCPLLDPRLIAAVTATWHATGADYVSTITPRCLPRGLDVELITVDGLGRLDRRATGPHRTHVTSLVYSEPGDFDIVGVTVHPPAQDLRVTLDTEDDARLLDALVDRLGDRPPRWNDVVHILRASPELRALNAHVTQKALVDG